MLAPLTFLEIFRMKALSFTLIAFLIGCANTPEPNNSKQQKKSYFKHERVDRTLTLSWDNMGLGGAALRQPAYIHVLGEGTLHKTIHTATFPNTQSDDLYNPEKITVILNEINSSPKKGYSLYELSRWRRFCNQGKDMDEADWNFINIQGRDNIPSVFHDHCIPPNHTYKAYVSAWETFCSNAKISSTQRQIVTTSVKPTTKVGRCSW